MRGDARRDKAGSGAWRLVSKFPYAGTSRTLGLGAGNDSYFPNGGTTSRTLGLGVGHEDYDLAPGACRLGSYFAYGGIRS